MTYLLPLGEERRHLSTLGSPDKTGHPEKDAHIRNGPIQDLRPFLCLDAVYASFGEAYFCYKSPSAKGSETTH
jgi:hypothetical protein